MLAAPAIVRASSLMPVRRSSLEVRAFLWPAMEPIGFRLVDQHYELFATEPQAFIGKDVVQLYRSHPVLAKMLDEQTPSARAFRRHHLLGEILDLPE